MGFWSSLKEKIKKAAKGVWRVVKAVARMIVRLVMTVVGAVLGILDLLLGFIAWPPKRLRLHIAILSDSKGPLVDPAALTPSVDFAKRLLKDRFNVKLRAYSENMIEVIKEPAPPGALSVGCGGQAIGEEFGEGGEWFAKHLAGWNGVPISLTFPITVFVVRSVKDLGGCSLGPLTDYITVDTELSGLGTASLMAHEIGHACNLWHSGTKANVMYKDDDRGDGVKGFQKNLFRSSRHVTYW